MNNIVLARLKDELEEWKGFYEHPADRKQHAFFTALIGAIEELEAAQRERDEFSHRDYLTWHAAACKFRAERDEAEAELKRRDAQESAGLINLTNEQIDEILDSRGNIAYVVSDKRERLRMFAREVIRAAAVPEKVVKLPEAYTVESVWGQVHYDCNENGDNYDTESIHEALTAAGVKYEVKK